MKELPKLKKILGFLLILPLLVIVIYMFSISGIEIAIEDVNAVEISDKRYIHRYTGKDDIEKYVSLVVESEDGAVQEIDRSVDPYIIKFEMKDGETKTYYFYPSLTEKSVLVDSMGLVRNVEGREDILLRPEFESFYSDRYIPEMFVNTEDGACSILPRKYSWKYRKSDSAFYTYTDAETSDVNESFPVFASVVGEKMVSFSVEPDEFSVSYTVNGKTYDSIETLQLSNGEELEVWVSASWTEKADAAFFGDCRWSFICIYRNSPVVYLEKNNINSGECLVLRTENIQVGETVAISTEIITGNTAKAFKGEQGVFALVPVGVDTPSGTYGLTVTAANENFFFEVNVSSESKGFYTKNINDDVYNKVTSSEGIKQYEDFISSIKEKSDSGFLWETASLLPPCDKEVGVDFATEILYNGIPPQILFEGISYDAEEKTSVIASAKGKVVFAGETAKTGKAVVIDHGCGIMTHYYHLSVVSAFEGESIEAGGLVGLSGSTGFTDKADLYFAVSINGVFVDPNLFFN